MTFDLSPDQQALAQRTRDVAASIGDGVAHVIDTLGAIPEDVAKLLKAQSLRHVFEHGVTSALIVIEELATVSAGLAAHVGFEAAAGADRKTVIPHAWPGLRSAELPLAAVEVGGAEIRMKGRLAAAAVALGIGRAAVAHAVASMKKLDVKPGPDTTVPHWALADGATEVEAARLLTYSAAQSLDRGEDASGVIARAFEFASKAAQRAVDAAIRVEGTSGYARGGLLERLARGARTLQLILR